MLIVPMTRKISWRNPPAITIVLLLVNCFVYFGIQSGDAEKQQKAWAYYSESGLAQIEIGRFVEYAKAAGRAREIPIPPNNRMKDPLVVARLSQAMMEDSEFMRRLNRAEIITPEDPEYSKWQSLKTEHERLASEVTSVKYGYKPATGNASTAFTYMFLHGSALHLIGNMVFLWLVGCTLELAGRRSIYALIYLVTGVISALSFGLVYKTSVVPLVGASGAVSGIIGAYTVLYGRTKVRVFYSLGFYFGYARVAAISLLPVWVGNEIFQLYFGGVSNVAYVAHIGGLASGAALGFAQRTLFGGAKPEPVEAGATEKLASLMESGLQKLSELDLQAARSLMQQALEIDPENRVALTHLFNIDKLNPERETFHATAARLLLRLHREGDGHKALYETYKEYCRIAKRPALPPDVWSRLGAAFSQCGLLDDSSRIVGLLLRNSPQFPAIPTLLLSLSRAYTHAGISDKGADCLRLLCRRFPDSEESQIAQGMLKSAA